MGQISFAFSKIKRAIAAGNLLDKSKRYITTRLQRPFQVVQSYFRASNADRNLKLKDGFVDHQSKKSHHKSNPEHIKRIISAYKKAKASQKNLPLPFQIRGVWEEWLSMNYKDLVDALVAENIEKASNLFENLFREQFTNGAGGYDNYIRYQSPLGGLYIRHMWCEYRNKLD